VSIEVPPVRLSLVLTAYAALLGACLGSFLNVCILRWGAEPKQSVVRPPSRCPKCGRGLAWYDNVPVVSWLVLRGRCRGCGEPISIQYPLVELATAVIWGYFAWRHGLTLEALRDAVFGTLLLGIAMTDAREYIIPNEFTYGGMALGLLLSFPGGPRELVDSLQGIIFGAGFLYLIGALGSFLARRDAMGGGDVAMMAMVGGFLGWESVLATIFGGACIGVVLHLVSLAVKRPRHPATAAALEPAKAPPPAVATAPGAAPDPPPATDPEFKTKEELRAEGYLPFGVSLAIAAAIIVLVDARGLIVAWFGSYADSLGL
jgi:leader peptidase (prepilin peptidase)/N-methyltransferase